MSAKAKYLELIKQEKKGILNKLLNWLLSAASILYIAGLFIKKCLCKLGIVKKVKINTPIISVGNITCGGTGKTPFCEFLARYFAERKKRVCVIARGYGKIPNSSIDDEDMPGFHIPYVSRFTGNKKKLIKITQNLADVIIVDDGFQRIDIEKNLDLLLIDATDPFSNKKLLPAGLLREPVGAIKRANIIVLTRTNLVHPKRVKELCQMLTEITHGSVIVRTTHTPTQIVNLSRRFYNFLAMPPKWLNKKRVYAFCSIANPVAFLKTLQKIGAKVVRFKNFPDHYIYKNADIAKINAEAREFMVDVIITTEKDALKINSLKIDTSEFQYELFVLRVEIKVVDGWNILKEILNKAARISPVSETDNICAK
jgi:tetraacyldisaccharide 4'-kinase